MRGDSLKDYGLLLPILNYLPKKLNFPADLFWISRRTNLN